MIESIENSGKLLSLIIRAQYDAEGIEFFTPDSFSQQLGYMKREKGHIVQPHIHQLVKRDVSLTQEVLYVKSGKVRVDYYDDNKIYLESRLLYKGDVVLLAFGGHGFEMLEESEMIEIKQGPYNNDLDKIVFDFKRPDEINFGSKK